MTELLAQIEGLERGPAGNTSLATAFVISQEMDDDEIIVVQETEYTGAGKHVLPQLSFARNNGIEIKVGNPEEEIPGKTVILPDHPSKMMAKEMDLNGYRRSYINNAVKRADGNTIELVDFEYLCTETKMDREKVTKILEDLGITIA